MKKDDFNFFNFNNVDDLKDFVANVLDGYIPYQLEDIKAEYIYKAIDFLKINDIPLTGNALFNEAIYFACDKAEKKVINWRGNMLSDEINELTTEEITLLDNFADYLDAYNLFGSVVYCFCNGSLDSSAYFVSDMPSEYVEATRLLIEHTDIFEELADDINLDLDSFRELYLFNKEESEDEPDICD